MPVPVTNVANMLGALERAKLTPKEGGAALELMFNPESLSISRSAQWKPKPSKSMGNGKPSLVGASGSGGSSPMAAIGGAMSAATSAVAGALGIDKPGAGEVISGFSPNIYGGSQPGTLTMVVHFNDSFSMTGLGDVSKHISTLERWMFIPKGKGQKPQPPLLVFTWGKVRFVGYIKTLNVTYMHFGADGSPVHAKASIAMTEEPEADGDHNPTSGGPPGRRTHRVGAGDSLQSIAYREYATPTVWRRIAEANGIDDPLRLRLGAELLVPLAGEPPA